VRGHQHAIAGGTLLPLFQCDRSTWQPRQGVRQVVAALRDVGDGCDDRGLGLWLVRSNAWLCDAQPVACSRRGRSAATTHPGSRAHARHKAARAAGLRCAADALGAISKQYMSRKSSSSPGARRLSMQPLGLSGQEEAVYRELLRHPGLSTLALGQLVYGIDTPLEDMLSSLQQRGLLRRGDVGWIAAAPEVAIELLLMERQAELHEARSILPELQEELARDSSTASANDVQILPADADSQLHAYLKLYEQARSSIVSVLRPPFLVAAPEAMEAARKAARKRGVRIRTILPPEVMKWDGWPAAAAQALAAGDELRVLDALPFKLLLVDDCSAMLPLHADDPGGPALRLGNTAVLTALSALFEQLWSEAVPALETAGDASEAAADSDAALHELVTVLAAGANDKTAAHVLGISGRTFQRRMTALNTRLRAKSRFQAGWLAARNLQR